ncbi:MAG: N-acetylglucosamine-6-phosphate deacetylase [Ruminococcaceae bacterium]|nr:N-acetylglucosamine-6-phosphate deacetylase [Oscillospiraceae bacterium]
MVTKIVNGVLVDHELKEGLSIYVKDGKMIAITEQELPCDEIYDAKGCYVSAGFIDIHTHGGGGADVMDGTTEDVLTAAKMHLTHGTTSIFPTTVCSSVEQSKTALNNIKDAMVFPTIRGAHMEGSFFDIKNCGAQNPDYIREINTEEIEEYLKTGIVKRIDFAPELSGSAEFAKYLTEKGVVSAVAHSGAFYEDVLPAYEQGCKLVTHLYSATSTVVRIGGFRHLGVIESAFLLDDMMVEVIADGLHLPIELLQMIYKIKGVDKICMITDSMRAAGMPEGESICGGKKEGMKCIVEDGVAKLPDRSAFAGSVATTDRLVRVVHKDAGIPLPETIQMMTENPAKVMGLTTKGRLMEGYDADLVIFDDNIQVKAVFVDGKLSVENGELKLS